jgi:OFA family oxalate/formate antiporter-like MFS transporter
MATVANPAGSTPAVSAQTRWMQLLSCVLCMVLIANLQYGWTFFVNPINKAHGWSIASIQVAFTIFIALETWLTPVHGWIADSLGRIGPKIVVSIGGLFVAAGWIINSKADSLEMLYLGAVVGGTGGGAVYATCVGQAVKWFPDRRGLAVGLTAAGYGAGTAITVIPILNVINAYGYETAFFWFGLIQGGLVFLLGWVLRPPEPGEVAAAPAPKVAQSSRSYTPLEALKTPVFWVLYIMFVMVSASGLMATAQLAPIAKDFGIAGVVLVGSLSTLALAGIVDNICNGGARPLFGWISDNIGREYTMVIAFGLGGISYWLLGTLGHAPWGFVIFAALIFLTWGEIFSLFPSTCTDTFGTKFATVNLSLLYTAKGLSAFLTPVANLIKDATGGWHMVFVVTAIMNFVVVALALFVLKPLRARTMAKS